MNNIEKSLFESIDRMIYGNFDVVESLLSFKTFVEAGYVKCPVAIQEMSAALKKCMIDSRHPTLNPSIDDIYKFKSDNCTGDEAIETYVKENGDFKIEKLDNTKNFLEITVPFKFLIVNGKPFAENEKIEIKKAEVQTALFKKEIK